MSDPGLPADIGRLIVAASADGIIAMDDQGIVRLCNPAAEELFARPARDLIGTQFGFPVVAGRAAEVELRLPGGGERVVEMRVIATSLEGERLHIAALRDITHRKRAERELQAALERQNLMVGVAAHELHNPLAAISVLAHTLRDRQAAMTPPQRTAVIDRIIERTTTLQSLVRKLLTASSIDTVGVHTAPEQTPLLEVILERIADLGEKAGAVEVSCDPGLAAFADRAELSAMIGNYLDNALAYAGPPIQVRASQRDGWAQIKVVDHGPGVPEDFAPRLFERFTRAPASVRQAEGAGLGLWIVRSYARANAGDAWHEPTEGGGACFCLRLPLAGGDDAQAS